MPSLPSLSNAITILSETHPDMSLTQLRLLLLISKNDNQTFAFFLHQSGLSRNDLANNLRNLAGWRNRQAKTAGLINITKDIRDRRISLSDRGKELLRKLEIS